MCCSEGLARAFAAGIVTPLIARRHSALRWPAALPRPSVSPGAAKVAIAAVSLELPAALLMTRAEPILPAGRLPDREIGCRPRWRRLPFRSRQGCPNQRPMDGSLLAAPILARLALASQVVLARLEDSLDAGIVFDLHRNGDLSVGGELVRCRRRVGLVAHRPDG